ncbi:hypothetical protein Pcinc_017572 [Petrolisthes cinctipes]|uniref:Uncharacterized protein n=1 Tax=Petrolisthes cinctipes TaxID=88211 RepID=A0AAE1FP03_PETCI|nr:hypothetical protein Pcinc_017572 [Petrolisthes cinctipes]
MTSLCKYHDTPANKLLLTSFPYVSRRGFKVASSSILFPSRKSKLIEGNVLGHRYCYVFELRAKPGFPNLGGRVQADRQWQPVTVVTVQTSSQHLKTPAAVLFIQTHTRPEIEMATPRDRVVGRNNEGQTTFINWKPRDIHSLANGQSGNMNVYKKVTEVVRTIHFEDYERDKGHLVPKYLTDKSHSHLTEEDSPEELLNMNGLCFGMYEQEERNSQNWYGNVNFITNLNTFLNEWKLWQVYFMEVTEYRNTNTSRLLVTSDDYSEWMEKYDPYTWGGPWYRRQDGTNFFLWNARRYNNESSNNLPHVIELFFILTREEIDLLMAMSKIEAANHKHDNNFKSRGCKKYRSGLQRDMWVDCPSPWSVQETQEKLNNISY